MWYTSVDVVGLSIEDRDTVAHSLVHYTVEGGRAIGIDDDGIDVGRDHGVDGLDLAGHGVRCVDNVEVDL